MHPTTRITLHFTTFHYTSRHYITLYSTTYTKTTTQPHPLHATTRHYTPLHSTTLLQYTKLLYTTQNYTTLHYPTLQPTTLHYTPLHYITQHYITHSQRKKGKERRPQAAFGRSVVRSTTPGLQKSIWGFTIQVDPFLHQQRNIMGHRGPQFARSSFWNSCDFSAFPGPVAENAWMKLWMTMKPQLGWNLKRIKFIQLCLTQYWYEATPKRSVWDLPTRLPGCQYTRGSQYWVWNGERSTASCNMHNRILCTGALYPKHLGIKSTITWKQRAAKELPGNWTQVTRLLCYGTSNNSSGQHSLYEIPKQQHQVSLDLWTDRFSMDFLCAGGVLHHNSNRLEGRFQILLTATPEAGRIPPNLAGGINHGQH